MPEWRHEIRRRLASARLRAEREAEIVDEIAQHLDDSYGEKIASGVAPSNAEREAWAELEHGRALAAAIERAEVIDRRLPPPGAPVRGSVVASAVQDARYAIRRLTKRPVFAATAIVTVALTVGPATAVIGMADAVFMTMPTGVAAPERLLNTHIAISESARGYSPWAVAYDDLDRIVAASSTVTGMTAQGQLPAVLSAGDAVGRRIDGLAVRPNYFDVLGVRFVAGRPLSADEDAVPGGVTSAVLSSEMAVDLFGSEHAAVGKSIALNGEPFSVVGVVDRKFRGTNPLVPTLFWIPSRGAVRVRHLAAQSWTLRPNRGPANEFIVRLAPGVHANAAIAELDAAVQHLPDASPTAGLRVQPGLGAPASANVRAFRTVRLLFLVCGALVLLGIANMANLMIFQGVKARREAAVRKALGASAARLLQMTMIESLIVSGAGAIVGLFVAIGIQQTLEDFPIWGLGAPQLPLDWRVLGATSLLAAVVGLAFGIGPALLHARGATAGALGRGERPGAARTRQILASTQLAVSLVLVIGALLFLATIKNLRAIDLGFDPAHVSTARIDLRSRGYDQPRMLSYYRQLIADVRRQPGVESAAVAYSVPLIGGSFFSSLYLPGSDPKTGPEVVVNYVSARYFDALRAPIALGRGFTDDESLSVAPASTAVLSPGAAKLLFPNGDALGKTVVEPGRPAREYTVIGITGEMRATSLKVQSPAVAYLPFGPGTSVTGAMLVVRSSRSPGDALKLMQASAAALDPSAPLYRDQTMDDILSTGIAEQRLFAWVLSLLGTIAFALAAVGLYGLVSQMVAERSREFGIRVAIGASASAILSLIGKQAAVVTIAGVIAGLGAAGFAARIVESYLFGVTSTSPVVFAGATVLLALVVGGALVGPSRTALRIDPNAVLRSE